MDATYPGRGIVSEKSRKLLETWGREDPVDDRGREGAHRRGKR